jgi:hypothetical protein
MATVSLVLLSGSVDGKAIKIAATASPGTLIHTAHATALDRLYLEVYNSHTADVVGTLQWGGTTSPDNDTVQTILFKAGATPLLPIGRLLTNSLVVRMFAGTTNVLTVNGYVHRHT